MSHWEKSKAQGWKGRDLPSDWAKRREIVKHRAGGQCEARLPRSGNRCPRRGEECDHIIPGFEGGTDDLENLQWLCSHHHRQKTSQEGLRGRARKKAKPPRRVEEHPGKVRRPGGGA